MTERVHAYDARMFLQLSAGFGRVSVPVGRRNARSRRRRSRTAGSRASVCRELTHEEIKTFIRKFAGVGGDRAEGGIRRRRDPRRPRGLSARPVRHRHVQPAHGRIRRQPREPAALRHRDRARRSRSAAATTIPSRSATRSRASSRTGGRADCRARNSWRRAATFPEGIEAAKILESAGYDAFNGDVGSYDSWYWSHPPMYQAKGLYLPYNAILKEAVGVPVITAGRMDNPDLAVEAIQIGQDRPDRSRPAAARRPLPAAEGQGREDGPHPALPLLPGRLHGPARCFRAGVLRGEPGLRPRGGVRADARDRAQARHGGRRRRRRHGGGARRSAPRPRGRALRKVGPARRRRHSGRRPGLQGGRSRADPLVRAGAARAEGSDDLQHRGRPRTWSPARRPTC